MAQNTGIWKNGNEISGNNLHPQELYARYLIKKLGYRETIELCIGGNFPKNTYYLNNAIKNRIEEDVDKYFNFTRKSMNQISEESHMLYTDFSKNKNINSLKTYISNIERTKLAVERYFEKIQSIKNYMDKIDIKDLHNLNDFLQKDVKKTFGEKQELSEDSETEKMLKCEDEKMLKDFKCGDKVLPFEKILLNLLSKKPDMKINILYGNLYGKTIQESIFAKLYSSVYPDKTVYVKNGSTFEIISSIKEKENLKVVFLYYTPEFKNEIKYETLKVIKEMKDDVHFVLITDYPIEWDRFEDTPLYIIEWRVGGVYCLYEDLNMYARRNPYVFKEQLSDKMNETEKDKYLKKIIGNDWMSYFENYYK